MQLKTTLAATERGAITVSFIGMPTVRVLLTAISGVKKGDLFSSSSSFIPREPLELVESPGIELLIKSLASPFLSSNTLQILEGENITWHANDLFGLFRQNKRGFDPAVDGSHAHFSSIKPDVYHQLVVADESFESMVRVIGGEG